MIVSVAMDMRPETETTVHLILDTFSGADGGGDFADFRSLVEEMDRRAAGGDAAAEKILKVVTDFARLIEVAKRLGARGRYGL